VDTPAIDMDVAGTKIASLPRLTSLTLSHNGRTGLNERAAWIRAIARLVIAAPVLVHLVVHMAPLHALEVDDAMESLWYAIEDAQTRGTLRRVEFDQTLERVMRTLPQRRP
jgi:hypothetical protein